MGQTLITAINRVPNILWGFVLMPCQVWLSRTESPLNAFKRNMTQQLPSPKLTDAYRNHRPQVTHEETEAKANAEAEDGDSVT